MFARRDRLSMLDLLDDGEADPGSGGKESRIKPRTVLGLWEKFV